MSEAEQHNLGDLLFGSDILANHYPVPHITPKLHELSLFHRLLFTFLP